MADAGNADGRAGRQAVPALRALGGAFRHASDAKLLKVTRLIDRLPERGQADALLDPVRDRLAALRPARHVNRSRLLFTPFNRVLVPASRWRSGTAALPRSLVAPVLALLDASGNALPAEVPFDSDDPVELNRNGRPLWNAAAMALRGITIPQEWAAPGWQMQSGISVSMLEQMLPAVAFVLRHAFVIRTLPPCHDPAFETAVTDLLGEATRRGVLAWGLLLALLFDQGPADVIARLGLQVARCDRMGTILQAGIDHAIDEMVVRLEQTPDPPAGEYADAPSLLLGRLTLMQQIEALRKIDNRPPDEQRRIARLRLTMAALNRSLFEHILLSLLGRIEIALLGDGDSGYGNSGGAAFATLILSLEADARQLRAFVLAAACCEDVLDYERMLGTATLRLAKPGRDAAGNRVARMRLVELLAGSERALQLFALS